MPFNFAGGWPRSFLRRSVPQHLFLAHKPAPSFKTLNEVFGKWLAHGFLERNCATRPRDWSQGKM
jgi:hypothetical protein